MTSDGTWTSIEGGSRVTDYNIYKQDLMTGTEIIVEVSSQYTSVGQMFCLKWKENNKDSNCHMNSEEYFFY